MKNTCQRTEDKFSRIYHEKKNIGSRIAAALLTLVMLFLVGCPSGGDLYLYAEEEYSSGWILHNINDSTPTVLDYDKDKLMKALYTFNYPGEIPIEFDHVYFWEYPWISGDFAGFGTENSRFAVPMNRTYYYYSYNENPQAYVRPHWKRDDNANLAYDQFGSWQSWQTEEMQRTYRKNSDYGGWQLAREDDQYDPGKIETRHYGNPPYRPANFNVQQFLIGANNEPSPIDILVLNMTWLEGSQKDRSSYFWKMLPEGAPMPYFNVYINNTLDSHTELSTRTQRPFSDDRYYYYWDNSKGGYYFNPEKPGRYKVVLYIPTAYPVWSEVTTTVTFDGETSQFGYDTCEYCVVDFLNVITELPRLDYIDIPSKFSDGEFLPVEIKFLENAEIVSVSFSYSADGVSYTEFVMSAGPSESRNLFSGSFAVPSGARKLDIYAKAVTSENQIYSINVTNASIRTRNVVLEIHGPEVVYPLEDALYNVTCHFDEPFAYVRGLYDDNLDDDLWACKQLMVNFYIDGKLYKRSGVNNFLMQPSPLNAEFWIPVNASDTIGIAQILLEVPYDTPDSISVMADFKGTGNLLPAQSDARQVTVQKLTHNLILSKYKVNSSFIGLENTIFVTVVNAGTSTEENVEVRFDETAIGSESPLYSYSAFIDSIDPGEMITVPLIWIPSPNYGLMSLAVILDSDESPGNNLAYVETQRFYKGPQLTPSLSFSEMPLITGKPNQVKLRVQNSGLATATNVMYEFYALREPDSFTFAEGNSSFEFNGTIYNIDVARIDGENNSVLLTYGGIEEQFIIADNYMHQLSNSFCVKLWSSETSSQSNMYDGEVMYRLMIGRCEISKANLPDLPHSYNFPDWYSAFVNWTPTKRGFYYVTVYLQNDHESFPQDNFVSTSIFVVPPGPNLVLTTAGFIPPTSEQNGRITLTYENDGTTATQETSARMITASDIYYETPTFDEPYTYTFNGTEYTLHARLKSRQDQLLAVNLTYYLGGQRAELQKEIFSGQPLLLDNGALLVIHADSYSGYAFVIMGLIQSESEFVVPSIPPHGFLSEHTNFTLPPREAGQYALFFEAYNQYDILPADNFAYETYTVYPVGPDIVVRLERINDSSIVVGEPAKITLNYANRGNRNASNAIIMINASSGSFYTDSDMTLRTELVHLVEQLPVQESGSLEFYYISHEDTSAIIEARLVNPQEISDIYPETDYGSLWVNVVQNVTDLIMDLETLPYPRALIIGEENIITGYYRNIAGRTSGRSKAEILIDGIVVSRQDEISPIDLDGYGTIQASHYPTEKRHYNITATITEYSGEEHDIDPSNNMREIMVPAASWINLTLNITDSNGDPVTRYIFADSGVKDFFTGTAVMTTLDHVRQLAYYYVSEPEDLVAGIATYGAIIDRYESVRSDIIRDIQAGDIFADLIFASVPSWNYSGNEFYAVLRLSDLQSDISNISVYGCSSFDFDQAACTTGWVGLPASIYTQDALVQVFYGIGNYDTYAIGSELIPENQSLTKEVKLQLVDEFSFGERIDIMSNTSNISDASWNEENSQLSFTISGPTGFRGVTNINANKEPISILIDGAQIPQCRMRSYDCWRFENGIISLIYFHSTHKIDVLFRNAANINYALGAIIGLILTAVIFTGFEAFRSTSRFDRLHSLAIFHGVHTIDNASVIGKSQKLEDYIRHARKFGFSDDKIREKLQSVGWRLIDIENALGQVKPPKD